MSKTPQGNKRNSRRAKSVRINLIISDGLLDKVDQAAKQDFTTRSEIIRSALLWYLRPQGRDLNEADTDEILRTLQRRKAGADLRKYLKDNKDDIDVYDT